MSKILLILFLVLLVSFQFVEMKVIKEIPEKFFGSFKLDKSEGFDEYLKTKDVNWFLRKLICMSSVTYVIEKGSKPGTYTVRYQSIPKNIDYVDFKLDETFEGEGMDGSRHKLTFSMPNENTLDEHHLRFQIEKDDNEELYHNTIEGNFLLQTFYSKNKEVTVKRWHKRVPK